MLSWVRRLIHKKAPNKNSLFCSVGPNTTVPRSTDVAGGKNICVGHDVYIGPRCVFYSTKARLLIGNHIMIGPEVMIITGDHRIDVPGMRLDQVTDEMKLPENDRDVVIEDDVWVGARAIVLKGVTVHTGAVIAAGAVVLEDVPPYSVYYSKGKIRPRFQNRITHQ